MNIGDQASEFYILLKGVVSIQKPNPFIKERIRKNYETLLHWKKTDYDPREKIARLEHTDKYQEEVHNKQLKQRIQKTQSKFVTDFHHAVDDAAKYRKVLDNSIESQPSPRDPSKTNSYGQKKKGVKIDKQKRKMRRADTLFTFDPKTCMNLTEKEI